MCATNVYCQYDKSFNNAQTIKMDLLNKFKCLILTKALLEPFFSRQYGWGFPIVKAYVLVFGKTVQTMSCFEQEAQLRSLPILVVLLLFCGASQGINCTWHPWCCSLGVQFYSCLP